MSQKNDAGTFTMDYLKVHLACFNKILKLIFHKQPTNLAPFSQVFLYF